MAEKEVLHRIARTITADGKYSVDREELLEHQFRVLATGSIVKFRDTRSGDIHEKECFWCQDTTTNDVIFIPVELLEETE